MNLDYIKITPILESLKLQKISDSIYFSEPYKAYISNSRLGLINPDQNGSPEQFFNGFTSKYSPSFELGSAIHMLSLQSDLFELCTSVNKPSAKMGALADKLYPIYQEREVFDNDIIKAATDIDYYGGLLTQNKIANVHLKCNPYWASRKDFETSYNGNKELIYLDERSSTIVQNCVMALKNNKAIQKLLHPVDVLGNPIISECEQAILLDFKVEIPNYDLFILRFKAKLDNYTIDESSKIICVNDIKSIGKIVSEIYTNIERYRYNREFAVYAFLLNLCAKKFYNMDSCTVKGNYLVVSTIPQHYTKVVPTTKKMFYEGMKEFIYLMKLVAYHTATKYKEFGIWK